MSDTQKTNAAAGWSPTWDDVDAAINSGSTADLAIRALTAERELAACQKERDTAVDLNDRQSVRVYEAERSAAEYRDTLLRIMAALKFPRPPTAAEWVKIKSLAEKIERAALASEAGKEG